MEGGGKEKRKGRRKGQSREGKEGKETARLESMTSLAWVFFLFPNTQVCVFSSAHGGLIIIPRSNIICFDDYWQAQAVMLK